MQEGREGGREGGEDPDFRGERRTSAGERLAQRLRRDAGRQQLAGGVKEGDNFKECVCVCVCVV